MSSTERAERLPYVVPRYRVPDDAVWYHVLHGNVPGHQIDFVYCPDVPQGALTQTHFGHVSRLIKYIEPRERASYAFAFGNLSRDDVQHEPGHGGIALIFGLRVGGVVDHAGRTMPPYAHGVIAVDRALDSFTLLDAASAFYRRVEREGLEEAGRSFYRAYVQAVLQRPETVEDLLRRHIDSFDMLPQPRQSDYSWDWVANEAALPRRVTIVHADDAPFGTVAHTAAQLGALLYRSNIKWTSISNGRELDIPGGLSIRFVPASQASPDSKGMVVPMGDLPDEEAELARMLFGAKPRMSDTPAARVGWRKQRSAQTESGSAAREVEVEVTFSERLPAFSPPSSRGVPNQPEGASSTAQTADPTAESVDVTTAEPPAALAPEPTLLEADPGSAAGADKPPSLGSEPVVDTPVTTPGSASPPVEADDGSIDVVLEPKPRRRRVWIGIAGAAMAGLVTLVLSKQIDKPAQRPAEATTPATSPPAAGSSPSSTATADAPEAPGMAQPPATSTPSEDRTLATQPSATKAKGRGRMGPPGKRSRPAPSLPSATEQAIGGSPRF